MKKKPHVVIIDHFDSFTYNLVVAFENLGAAVRVFRTNTDMAEVRRAEPTHIILSPGPGHPKDARLFHGVLGEYTVTTPILGVCLGFQAIAEHFGAIVGPSPKVMHGKTSLITHSGLGIFENLSENPFTACRYHSLAIVVGSIPKGTLLQTAWSEVGVTMGIQSVKYPNVVGVQFHPESLFTPKGSEILANFLELRVKEQVAHYIW